MIRRLFEITFFFCETRKKNKTFFSSSQEVWTSFQECHVLLYLVLLLLLLFLLLLLPIRARKRNNQLKSAIKFRASQLKCPPTTSTHICIYDYLNVFFKQGKPYFQPDIGLEQLQRLLGQGFQDTLKEVEAPPVQLFVWRDIRPAAATAEYFLLTLFWFVEAKRP